VTQLGRGSLAPALEFLRHDVSCHGSKRTASGR
jgi:hypothetical protein